MKQEEVRPTELIVKGEAKEKPTEKELKDFALAILEDCKSKLPTNFEVWLVLKTAIYELNQAVAIRCSPEGIVYTASHVEDAMQKMLLESTTINMKIL